MFGAQYFGQVAPAMVPEVPRVGTGGGWRGAPVTPMPGSRFTGAMRPSKRPSGMKRPPWVSYTEDMDG